MTRYWVHKDFLVDADNATRIWPHDMPNYYHKVVFEEDLLQHDAQLRAQVRQNIVSFIRDKAAMKPANYDAFSSEEKRQELYRCNVMEAVALSIERGDDTAAALRATKGTL